MFLGVLVMANIVLIACARKLPFGILLIAFAMQLLALPLFFLVGIGGV